MKKTALILSMALMVSMMGSMNASIADVSQVGEVAPAQGCIGIAVELTPAGAVLIDKVLDGTPAQTAGLQAGDIVEGVRPLPGSAMVSLQGKTLEEAVDLMRGDVGTEESLLVKRGNDELSVSMVRAVINNS